MGETIFALNANEFPKPCQSALERMQEPWDPQLAPLRSSLLFELAGAKKEDLFVFTSSGAEAVTQVLLSLFLEVSRKEGKCHFVTSLLEDAATLHMMKRLEELGCYVKIAPLNSRGEIDVLKLADLLNPRTALISVSMAQGLTGVIQPVEQIAQLAHSKGIRLHLDANYALGKYAFSFEELQADYLTFSGDQIHSVPGSGGLFAKEGAPLVPLILGGGLRGGSFDGPSFLALCSAAQQSLLSLDRMALEVARLRDLFESEVLRQIPEAAVLFQDSLRLPNTSALYLPRVHQEALQYFLQRNKLYSSIGGTASPHLHRLIAAAGLGEIAPFSSMSFSFSRMTTEEEVVKSAALLASTLEDLQSISRGIFYAAPE